MKTCPACRQQIHADALKCRFCGEFLIKCLECDTETASGLKRCHHCKKPLERSRRGLSSAQFKTVEERLGRPVRRGLGGWLLLLVGTAAVLVILWAAVLSFTGHDLLDKLEPLLDRSPQAQPAPSGKAGG